MATVAGHQRARIAVRGAVVAALDRIEQHDGSPDRQLHDGSPDRQLHDSVRTGRAYRYDPDPGRLVRRVLDG